VSNVTPIKKIVGTTEPYEVAPPLDRVEEYLRRFVVYPNAHAVVAHVLWIIHTHLMDCWDTTPRIAFMSPRPSSGKTRALEVSELLVPSPELSANTSAAAMVRIIAEARKEERYVTVLYDEIDEVFNKKEDGIADLKSAFNAGYRRNGRFTRCINAGGSIGRFACYAPLAMAGLKTLPDALARRTIFINMKPRANDEPKEDFILRDQPEQAEPIYDALAEWCEKRRAEISGYRPDMPAAVVDRNKEIWEPLITIADMAGGEWPDRARDAAVFLVGAAMDDSVKAGSDIELLIHIREAFLNADKIHADELVRRLCNREESPWMDMGWGKPLTTAILRERLKPYVPHDRKRTQVFIDGTNRTGYRLEDFHDAWKHYVDTLPQETASAARTARKLSNQDKNLAPLAPLAPGGRTDDDLEPGSFEPDELDLPVFLDRRQHEVGK
jgi:MoxR-like ATPase